MIYFSNSSSKGIEVFNKFTTNYGRDWELNDIINKKEITDIDPYQFHFLKRSASDSTLYKYNFNGEIIGKSNYFSYLDDAYMVFNPKDPNFIGMHFQRQDHIFEYFQHYFYYSKDYGENWNFISIETHLQEKRNLSLPFNVSIEFAPNIRNQEKSLFRYNWHNTLGIYYSITANFNFYTKKIKFYEFNSSVNNYSYLDEDEVLFHTNTQDSLIRFNLETQEKKDYSRFPNSIGWDPDSISGNNVNNPINKNGRYLQTQGFKTNSSNPDHQIISIIHYEYNNEANPVYVFINQYFFQSLDAGQNWDLIFENFDKFNLVQDFFINPKDMSLWIEKSVGTARSISFSYDYPKLYRSTSPLTSILSNINDDGIISAYFSLNDLIIDSNQDYNNSIISIYDLEGKKIVSTTTDLQLGINEIELNQKLNNGLYLVQIENSKQKQVVKLIRND